MKTNVIGTVVKEAQVNGFGRKWDRKLDSEHSMPLVAMNKSYLVFSTHSCIGK